MPGRRSPLICPICKKYGGLHRRAVGDSVWLKRADDKDSKKRIKKEDLTTLSKAWDYAAEICYRLHRAMLEYPPREGKDDEKLAKSLYTLYTKFCPHTEKELGVFESRQFRRFKPLEQKLRDKFKERKNKTKILHGNIEYMSDEDPVHTELSPDAGRITKSCIASFYGSIVFTVLSKVDKVLRTVLPNQVQEEIENAEKEVAWGIYAFFNSFMFIIDKRSRRSLTDWADLLRIKAEHGYHAAESMNYRLTSYCRNCSDSENGRFVIMSLLDRDLDAWRCDRCGGTERVKSKFTTKNVKKRESDIINEIADFVRYSPIFEKYLELRSNSADLRRRVLDEFDRCEHEAGEASFRKRQRYFMKHYDPSKKSKIRWCSLTHDNVLKVKINDSELRLLFKKVCDMILDDKRLEERRDVHNQYINKLTKLGFQEDIAFNKFAEDVIICYGEEVSELISQKIDNMNEFYLKQGL
jgi:hypothetical protein